MSNEIVAVDFRGNEIRVGDTVLYPRMSGRSVEMTEARVERIIEVEGGRRVQNPAHDEWIARRKQQATDEGQRYWFEVEPPASDPRPEGYIRVPAWKFSLMPLRSTRQFHRWDETKAVFIQIGENVVRVMDA